MADVEKPSELAAFTEIVDALLPLNQEQRDRLLRGARTGFQQGADWNALTTRPKTVFDTEPPE